MATRGKESENGVYEFPYMRPESKLTKWEAFQLAIWDPSTNQIFGRTFKSWSQLFIFYVIFYIILAALFAICMKGLLWSIDDNQPTYLLERSIIGTNPGMGFRPISNRTEEGSLIWYDAKNATSIRKWTTFIDEFLELYLNSSKLPGGGRNQEVCSFDKLPSEGRVCAVEVDKFGPCARENSYGYNNSAPCFFLKINRIYGWKGNYYNDTNDLPSDMPQDLVDHIKSLSEKERNQIWISCSGENPADKETIGPDLKYYPSRGFASFYYPYINTEGYLSPIVAVQVVRPKRNVLINIECRAWAKNINYHGGNLQREGSVHLELMVD